MRRKRGFSFIEMMISVLILSVLAAVALPYAERTHIRDKERELRENLRQIRSAIDRFHEDWAQGRIPPGRLASEDGYPKNLDILVQGVDRGTLDGGQIHYLRRVPRNPFADQRQPATAQWRLRSYRDHPGSAQWGGEDVYDVLVPQKLEALDGSCYCDW